MKVKNSTSSLVISKEDMLALGASVYHEVKKNRVIALRGNLGAGKTVFVKGFVKEATGLHWDEIASPTFQYVHLYDGPLGQIAHFDLWRLKSIDSFMELGLSDLLREGISLIEWPERIESLLPKDTLFVDIEILQDGRKVTISKR